MILYKRLIADKSGKLEKIKEVEFPSENLLSVIERIIRETPISNMSIERNYGFFIIFSKEEEIKLLNQLVLFSKNNGSFLLRGMFTKFFEDTFVVDSCPFTSYFCIVNDTLSFDATEPNLGIQFQ